MEKIFEKFFQNQAHADAKDWRNDDSTGYGLTITRDLMKRIGGSIRAHNLPDGGFKVVCQFRHPASQDHTNQQTSN
jgi:K+-sensing histidine kinase KdpD